MSAAPEPDQEPTPLELDSVFEEIAALEAQYVAQGAQPEPAIAPIEPRHALAAGPAEPLHRPALPAAEPQLAPQAKPAAAGAAAVPPDPEFDLMPPSPALQAADPFAPAPPGHAPSARPAEPLADRVPAEFTPGASARQAAAVPADPVFDFTPPAPALRAAAPFTPVPTELPHPSAVPPSGARPVATPRQAAPVPPGPVFDFTPPSPELHTADPFTRAGSTRSRQRYVVWAACVLAAVLLALGGRWFYQERNDAGSLALVADQTTAAPQADKAAQPPADAASASAAEGGAGAGTTPAAPAAPASPAAPGVPPMAMLEPGPSTAAKPEPAKPAAPREDAPRPAPKPEPVAEQASASPAPQSSSRAARAQSGASAQQATASGTRESARQSGSGAPETGQPEVQDTSMTATLKACRQRGYDAAQCVKRGCSMTRYGFACRGQ